MRSPNQRTVDENVEQRREGRRHDLGYPANGKGKLN